MTQFDKIWSKTKLQISSVRVDSLLIFQRTFRYVFFIHFEFWTYVYVTKMPKALDDISKGLIEKTKSVTYIWDTLYY